MAWTKGLAYYPALVSTLMRKERMELVQVTRAEADAIREEAPKAHIAIVNRGKRNKHYFAEESYEVRGILRRMRPELRQAGKSQNRKERMN